MAKTLSNLETLIAEVTGQSTVTYKSFINRSINKLSSFFQNDVVSEFNPNQAGFYLDTPSQSNRIVSISVNSEDIEDIESSDNEKIELAISNGVKRYYQPTASKIYTTWQVQTSDDVRIFYKKNFTELVNSADVCDVPDILLDLVVTGSLVFFYEQILFNRSFKKSSYPDISPSSLRNTLKILREDYDNSLVNRQIIL